MKSIAFFNNKGGVGKTTLLCNVAAYMAIERGKKVLIVDADPQCNATQLLLDEGDVISLYESSGSFTVMSIIHPLSIGKGYANSISPRNVPDYGVDLIPGDPKLALKEDLLSKDWQDAISGDVRGLRTSFLFSELLERCSSYDYVFFDMGPSLGSINRSVLLACDLFISPMSIDIFSLKAAENISTAILEWKKKLRHGMDQVDPSVSDDIPNAGAFSLQFIGYVAQQYIQKTRSGKVEAVAAYEKIMRNIPKAVKTNFIDRFGYSNSQIKYELGTIPNLYSLIAMSQSARKPIFALKAKDGVRGAHFNRVQDAAKIYEKIVTQLEQNISILEAA